MTFPPPVFALLLAFVPLAGAAAQPEATAPAPGAASPALPDGWWRDAVFYEIFVRSFADARSGPLAGDGIGDLQGLIEHLDYLNDGRGAAGSSLGVTALWLMPVHPSPSYHGYDVSDYFTVHPDFGDIGLFRRFLAEAHRRGIRVIVDFVLNHCAIDHPRFVRATAPGATAADRAWFRFAEVPEQVAGPWDQWVWHPSGDRFYYGAFDASMPDWDFRHPGVTEHHRRAAAFWLNDVGVDGFRLDAVRYFIESGDALQDTAETRAWLRDFTAYCHAVKPGCFVIGENTAHSPEVARTLRGRSLDSAFEFDLWRATVAAVRYRSPGLLTQTLDQLSELHGGTSPWGTLLTNHDQARARTQLDGDERRTRFATELLFTLPGVTFLYYGEELGQQAGKPDENLRTPMPWTAEPPNAGFTRADAPAWRAPQPDFRVVNVAAQIGAAGSMHTLYRQLIALRQTSPALRHGHARAISASDRAVYVALRESDGDMVAVVANFSGEPRRNVALSAPASALNERWTLHEALRGAEAGGPALRADGAFADWIPWPELAPETVYVLRWVRR